jgi:hypothetical protein
MPFTRRAWWRWPRGNRMVLLLGAAAGLVVATATLAIRRPGRPPASSLTGAAVAATASPGVAPSVPASPVASAGVAGAPPPEADDGDKRPERRPSIRPVKRRRALRAADSGQKQQQQKRTRARLRNEDIY